MNLIENLPNIYGVKVLNDEYYKAVYYASHNETVLFCNSDSFNDNPIMQLDGEYILLGTITATEISFDASEVVESTEIDVEQYDGILMAIPRFWDYELESFSCSSSDESFRSALPKEIYFENPIEEPDHLKYKHLNEWNEYVFTPRNLERYSEDYDEWQTAQQNITEKLLILQKL